MLTPDFTNLKTLETNMRNHNQTYKLLLNYSYKITGKCNSNNSSDNGPGIPDLIKDKIRQPF